MSYIKSTISFPFYTRMLKQIKAQQELFTSFHERVYRDPNNCKNGPQNPTLINCYCFDLLSVPKDPIPGWGDDYLQSLLELPNLPPPAQHVTPITNTQTESEEIDWDFLQDVSFDTFTDNCKPSHEKPSPLPYSNFATIKASEADAPYPSTPLCIFVSSGPPSNYATTYFPAYKPMDMKLPEAIWDMEKRPSLAILEHQINHIIDSIFLERTNVFNEFGSTTSFQSDLHCMLQEATSEISKKINWLRKVLLVNPYDFLSMHDVKEEHPFAMMAINLYWLFNFVCRSVLSAFETMQAKSFSANNSFHDMLYCNKIIPAKYAICVQLLNIFCETNEFRVKVFEKQASFPTFTNQAITDWGIYENIAIRTLLVLGAVPDNAIEKSELTKTFPINIDHQQQTDLEVQRPLPSAPPLSPTFFNDFVTSDPAESTTAYPSAAWSSSTVFQNTYGF